MALPPPAVMLKNEGGSVVNIASISGLRASTLRVAYGTSKAAIIHLTKQQAVEQQSEQWSQRRPVQPQQLHRSGQPRVGRFQNR